MRISRRSGPGRSCGGSGRRLLGAVLTLWLVGACTSGADPIVVNARPGTTADAGGTNGAETASSSEVDADQSNQDDRVASGPGVDGSSLITPLTVPRATSTPRTLWAIEDESFDLVAATTSTGVVEQRVGGWAAGSPDTRQYLTSVESGDHGLLWVDDCCEPAVGNVFAVDPEASLVLPDDAVIMRNGTRPQLSPNGSLVATSDAVIGVLVTATDGSDLTIDTDPVVEASNVLVPDAVVPLAWLSDQVLLVSSYEGPSTVLIPVNVSGVEAVPAAEPIEIEGYVVSADVNSAGLLVAAVKTQRDAAATAGRVIDPTDGSVTAGFALPDNTFRIDYDPSGTYLLVSTDEGLVSWQGNGTSGEGPGTFYGASW